MSKTINFKDIYIGVPDGELESQNKLFEKLFCDYNKMDEKLINDQSKYLVIGSKGSGKTYLAKYVYKKICMKKKNHAVMVSANDFRVERINELPKEEIDSDFIYALCRWFLLKKIAKMIIDAHPRLTRIPCTAYYKLKCFFDEYQTESVYKIINKTRTLENGYTKSSNSQIQFTKDKIVTGNGGISKSSNNNSRIEMFCERKKFNELLEKVLDLVVAAVKDEEKYFLIIDDLDELDRMVKSNQETSITLNMIKATKTLNTELNSKRKLIKTILLLRTDVLNRLQLFDMNLSKISTSAGIELYWLTDTSIRPEKHPLMKMILHKIKTSCETIKDIDDKELYDQLFPESIDGKPPLDYFLDYSLGRPRDIITYMNHIISRYPESSYFKAVEIKEVRKLYSADLYNEIMNEAYYHKEPEYTKQCLSLISGMKRPSFKPEDVKEFYESNKEKFPLIDSVDAALTFLYELSIIGNVWRDDSQKKSKYKTSWYYRKDSYEEIDLTKKVTIHYGLRKKFAIN